MGTGITSLLLGSSKNLWPTFLVTIGNFSLLNGPRALKGGEYLQELCLCLGEARGNVPRDLVLNHIKYVSLIHSMIHEVNFVERVFKGAQLF